MTVWDFETFRPIGFLNGLKAQCKALEFLPEHPLLISADACGIVCIYAVRGAPSKLVNLCLGKFVNLEPHGPSHVNIGITSMIVFYEKAKKSKYMHLSTLRARRNQQLIR